VPSWICYLTAWSGESSSSCPHPMFVRNVGGVDIPTTAGSLPLLASDQASTATCGLASPRSAIFAESAVARSDVVVMAHPESVITWNEGALERSGITAKNLLTVMLTAAPSRPAPRLVAAQRESTDVLIARYVQMYEDSKPRGRVQV
jgi:hypothetical protein